MIFTTDTGERIDTATLSSEERHILQKLVAWQALADSLGFFREKKLAALKAGWNGSGPVAETRALGLVIQQLEKELKQRLGRS